MPHERNPEVAAGGPEAVPARRDREAGLPPRGRRPADSARRPQHSTLWRRLRRRYAGPLAAVAIAVALPAMLFVLRAAIAGDAVVVDQRPGAVAPGPVAGAVPGGAIGISVPAAGVALPPGAASASVQLRLSSAARSRILIVRGPRGPFDLRPVWPQDGVYFDLGPLPRAGTAAAFSLRALHPAGDWGVVPAEPVSSALVAVDRDGVPLDYRVVARVPVSPLEAVARATFFLRHSVVAFACLALGLAGLVLALRWWLDERAGRACAALVAAVAMLFVSLTPPFCAADEIGHMGTMEYVLAGATEARPLYWPASMSLATFVLAQDRVRWQPDQALPLLTPAARAEAARALAPRYRAEAAQAAAAFAFTTQTTDEAPLFYPLAASLPRGLLALPLLERMFAYRAMIVCLALALIGAGMAGLRIAGASAQTFAGVAAVVLIPQWIGIASSTSPYSLGLGAATLAACLVVASYAMRRATAVLWLAAACLAAAAGALAVRECALLAALAAAVGAWRLIRPSTSAPPRTKALLRAALVAAPVVAGAAVLLGFQVLDRYLPANLRQVETIVRSSSFLAGTLPRWAPVIAAPLLAALLLALAERRARRSGRGMRAVTIGIPAAAVLLLLAAHAVFPDVRVPTSQFVTGMTAELFTRRVFKAFALGAFSWDQDFIAWKSFFGALGWHDVLLPPALYALGRWICVGIFLAIPALFVRAAAHDPRRARRMLTLAAAGAAVFLAATVARSSLSVLHGRFLLFAAPLMGVPLAAMAVSPRARRALEVLVALLVALDLFIVFYLLPCRYLLAGAGEPMLVLP